MASPAASGGQLPLQVKVVPPEYHLSNFEDVRTLRGCIHGKVRLMRHLPTNCLVAVKHIKPHSVLQVRTSRARGRYVKEDWCRELQTLRCVQSSGGHPNIVRLIEDFEVLEGEHAGVHIVMEFCDQGEFFDVLQSIGHWTAEDAIRDMYGVLSAVHFFHNLGFCHLDIGMENILMTSGGESVVSDYTSHDSDIEDSSSSGAPVPAPASSSAGSSSSVDVVPAGPRLVDLGGSHRYDPSVQFFSRVPDRYGAMGIGKNFYKSPRCIRGELFDGQKNDIWSCGVVFFMMLTGHPPWDMAWEMRDCTRCFRKYSELGATEFWKSVKRWGLHDRIPAEAWGLLLHMLDLDQNSRFTALECMQHPIFAELREEASSESSDTEDSSSSGPPTPAPVVTEAVAFDGGGSGGESKHGLSDPPVVSPTTESPPSDTYESSRAALLATPAIHQEVAGDGDEDEASAERCASQQSEDTSEPNEDTTGKCVVA